MGLCILEEPKSGCKVIVGKVDSALVSYVSIQEGIGKCQLVQNAEKRFRPKSIFAGIVGLGFNPHPLPGILMWGKPSMVGTV